MIRTFVALEIPIEVRNKIFGFIKEIVPDYGKFKWERSEKVHLTLKFIGNIKENILPDLENELSFIQNYNKFRFRLTGFNFFYRFKTPQILWVGLGSEDPLKKLVRDVEEVLTRFSVPPEKKEFTPHLTLMRIKHNPGSEFVEAFKNYRIPEVNFTADKLMLMQSLLKPSGSEYKEIKVFKLN